MTLFPQEKTKTFPRGLSGVTGRGVGAKGWGPGRGHKVLISKTLTPTRNRAGGGE